MPFELGARSEWLAVELVDDPLRSKLDSLVTMKHVARQVELAAVAREAI